LIPTPSKTKTTSVSRFGVPDLGVGVGFRLPHVSDVLDGDQLEHIDWFEVISENFMVGEGSNPLHNLGRLIERYPVVSHGVGASLGGDEDTSHTRELKRLLDWLDPPWVSDHCCWTGTPHARLHDLLPLPYTEDVIRHLVRRIQDTQQTLGRPFAIENVSSYLSWKDSTMTEWDFLAEVLERADCGLLLDVNNIFVSACNHGFDPLEYLDAIPTDRVVQIHLAGHTILPTHRLDTHSAPVCDEVWDLYGRAIKKLGPVSTLIEWDDDIPDLPRLEQEAARAREVRDRALA
jgi:uncharacterized protein